MKKTTLAFGLFVGLAIVGSIVYWQYTRYRVPATVSELGAIDLSEQDARAREDLLGEFSLGIREGEEIAHSIPLRDIISGGPKKDGIPSIDNPKFESVASADLYLDDNGYGLAIEVGGEHRFYPYQILVWHEIVNDTFGGEPLLITFCPLCYSGIVFSREVSGEVLEFGTSGRLWNNNLLMYDRASESLWSQILGEAVVGSKTGTLLEAVPALTVSWDDWNEAHPDGEVLSRNTGFSRDYTRDPYGDYYTNSSVWFPLSHMDDRLHVKTLVYAVEIDGQSKAFAEEAIMEAGIIHDQLDSYALLVLYDEEIQAVRMFDRRSGTDGSVLEFEQKDGSLIDKQTGSVWNFEGEAVGGSLIGTVLEQIPFKTAFWFSWVASHPETELY